MDKYYFKADTHEYFINEAKVPSVTAILPSREYRNCEWQRVKGQYVHDMIKLYLTNDLDEATLDPQLMPYLEAYKAAENIDFYGVIDLKSGAKSATVDLQLAGYVLLANEGVRADGTRPDIIEVETLLFHPVLQFAGTPDLIMTNQYPIRNCAALYLKENGKYKFEDHSKELRQNIKIFQCYLTVAMDKKRRGL